MFAAVADRFCQSVLWFGRGSQGVRKSSTNSLAFHHERCLGLKFPKSDNVSSGNVACVV